MRPTSSIGTLQALLRYGEGRGIEAAKVLRAAGVPGDPFEDVPGVPLVERRVPLEQMCAVWEALIDATGDPTMALEATGGLSREAYGVLMLVVRAAPDGRDSWNRAGRYMALWSDMARFELAEPAKGATGQPARIAWQTPPLAPRPGLIAARESGVASSFRHAQRGFGDERFPLWRVCFEHAAHADVAAYERYFGVPVVFGAPRTQLEFDPAALDRQLPTSVDPGIDAYLVARAEEVMARMPRAGRVTEDVRRVLTAQLASEPTIESVARALGLGERTLRRRLADEDTAFARVLDDVRRESAARALAEGRLGVGEIALLVGFSEPGAFVRAFKRWTGSTPGAWRSAQAARSSSAR